MLAYIDREKLKQEFKDIEHGIFVLTKGEWRATGYIRRVFYFLREHIELCAEGGRRKPSLSGKRTEKYLLILCLCSPRRGCFFICANL